MKRFLTVITLILFVAAALAQHKTNLTPEKSLLYVVDSKNHFDYLIPYIEQKLKNLRESGKDVKLYNEVVSLNSLTLSNTIRGEIITNLIDNRQAKDVQTDKTTIAQRISYKRYLGGYRDVLLIKVNILGNYIELQFTHFRSKNNKLVYDSGSSAFVNPEKQHYQTEIIRALKQVFPKAGSPPIFRMTYNNHPIINNEFLHFSTRDTISLIPIVQSESPDDDLQYFWSQDSVTKKNLIFLDKTHKEQHLARLPAGVYNFSFHVNDGILESDISKLTIVVDSVPTLKVKATGNGVYEYPRLTIDNFLLDRKPHVTFVDEISVEGNGKLLQTDSYVHFWIKGYNGKNVTSNDKKMPTGKFWPSLDNLLKEDIPPDQVPNLVILKSGDYKLNFQANSGNLKTDTTAIEIHILNRQRLSIYLETIAFPFHHTAIFKPQFGASGGVNLALSSLFNTDVMIGIARGQQNYSVLSTGLNINYQLSDDLTETFSVFYPITSAKYSQTLVGFKTLYSIFEDTAYKISFGPAFYNLSNNNSNHFIFGFSFSGKIFLNK